MMLIARTTRTTLQTLVLAACWALPTLLLGATVADLYSVTVERSLAAENPRADEMRRAMLEAVIRITGSSAIAQSPELEPLYATAARYVDTFGYSSDTEALVRFIPGTLERALSDLNLPVWGAERPLTIFWIAVADEFGEQGVLSSGEIESFVYGENMRRVLEETRADVAELTRARGLPYVLPLLDVLDLASVDFADVWNLELGALAEASARYGADAIAVARMRTSAIGIDVEWVVRMGFDHRSLPGASLPEGIDWLANGYAAQFASVGGVRPMLLRVTGVQDFSSYARIVSHLEDLSTLDRVDVESFRGGELMLRVESRGDAQVLARVLSLGGVLRASTMIGSPSLMSGVLNLEVVRDDVLR